ncbi:MAG: hypothetical protein ACXABV_09965 [Candidatus Thorarchaeota archaeon]|jgi:hypothetical protein
MGQGERIESLTHCPLTPSLERSLNPQDIKKSLNLHFRPNPILVVVSLALILMASGLVIIWMLIPVEYYAGEIYEYNLEALKLYVFAGCMWSLVILLLGGLIVIKRESMVE